MSFRTFSFLKCLYFFKSFLGRPTFPVFRFSSPASNRTTFFRILSPALGLEPGIALLGGIGVAFGVAGWLATSANVRESFPNSVLAGAGAGTGCFGGEVASTSIGLMKRRFLL
jgi:hypothetical protein